MSQTSLVPTYIIKCALFALLAMALLFSAASVQAASAVSSTEPTTAQSEPAETSTSVRPAATTDADGKPTLATELQPTDQALSAANQQLLSRNAQLQRQVNDLQTQANVLVYESKGQLFLYGAFTVLISLLVGIFISWLVFVRRERW
ncbi:MAG: hypothetical protein ACPHVZ_06715 [Psychrobacter sp.]|uniref:hypothetical protein n=1 Tax=Psychrobacter TaxID=497 RepID=UPI0003FB43BE|nr:MULTISPECIES: hypothetical protein [Psychrobacter]